MANKPQPHTLTYWSKQLGVPKITLRNRMRIITRKTGKQWKMLDETIYYLSEEDIELLKKLPKRGPPKKWGYRDDLEGKKERVPYESWME